MAEGKSTPVSDSQKSWTTATFRESANNVRKEWKEWKLCTVLNLHSYMETVGDSNWVRFMREGYRESVRSKTGSAK